MAETVITRVTSSVRRAIDAGHKADRGLAALVVRAFTPASAATKSSPARPGVSAGRVAYLPAAEADLESLARSPTVFAAIQHRVQGITSYPIKVYRGYSLGGTTLEPLDPSRVPWVGRMHRLLQTPDPRSIDLLAPIPGESLHAQIIVDLLVAGNYFIAPTLDPYGWPVGLMRLHPKCCAIERRGGRDMIVYRNGAEVREYDRFSVFHGRLVSWQSSGQGEMGTGAGAALAALVEAEYTALVQTAAVVRQGGADVMVTANSPAGANFLSVPANRVEIRDQVSGALEGAKGQRVIVLSSDVKVTSTGLDPADLRASETLTAANKYEMQALGVVPVAVGGEGTYATAVHQLRVQAEKDLGIANIIEASFFRPLARQFARAAGGQWLGRVDEVTARYDLSSHPGYTYQQKDAIERAIMLVEGLGYTPAAAIGEVGLDFTAPTGQPTASTLPGVPGPAPGSTKAPRRPIGDGEDPAPRVAQTVADLFKVGAN